MLCRAEELLSHSDLNTFCEHPSHIGVMCDEPDTSEATVTKLRRPQANLNILVQGQNLIPSMLIQILIHLKQ
jgi:hypothetical protein